MLKNCIGPWGAWFAALALGLAGLVSCADSDAHALGSGDTTVSQEPTQEEARKPRTNSTPVPDPTVVPTPEPAPEPEPSAPQDPLGEIRELKVVPLSPASVEVSWRTAHASDSEVHFGRDANLAETPIRYGRRERYHVVLLAGLNAGTTYSYQVSSTCELGKLTSTVGQFTTLRPNTYTVRNEHPRIFFTRADLDGIRQRIRGSHAAYWNKLTQNCNSMLSESNGALTTDRDRGANLLAMLAFAGLVGDNATFRRKAEEAALHAAGCSPSGLDRGCRRNSLEGMATVYDWLYPYLSSTTRATLRAGILRYMSGFGETDTDRIFGHGFENVQSVVQGAIALYGEEPEAKARLDAAVHDYRYNYFPSWRHYMQEGASVMTWSYNVYTLRQVFDALLALRSATDLDYFEIEPWPERGVEWLCRGLRDDNSFLRTGDGKVYDGFMARHRFLAVVLAAMYRNPDAQWLAQKMEREKGLWATNAMYDILFYDPALEARAPSGPTSKLFPQVGTVLARDIWGEGGVLAMFRSAPDYVMGHTHLDNNSFAIFYKGGQAIDSGYYDKFGSSHHRNYSSRTIAHNSMLVFDPAQKFRLYSSSYYANDGGQHWRLEPEEVVNARPCHIDEVLDPVNGFRSGGVIAYADNDRYTYVVGDAAGSYSATKLRSFDRHFLYLRSVTGYRKPVMVVFDWVVSTDAAFKKTYLLHTMRQPQVNGTMVSATNLGGMIFQQTLLPDSPKITLVGGSGKEFYVNGTNYPPSRSFEDYDEAGAWRVEVAPTTAATENHFLHVLHATDAGSSAPAAARKIAGTTMLGLRAGNWIALFPMRRGGVKEVTYPADGGAATHLLLGMVPLATYEVLVDGVLQTTVTASYDGTLEFPASGARLTVRQARA